MMERTFHARVTAGQYLGALLNAFLVGYGLWQKDWLLASVFMLISVVVVEQLVHSAYTLTADGQLVVRRGRFRRVRRVPLPDILLVERTRAPLFGMFAVGHYVLVHCKGGRDLALLPANETDFIRELVKRGVPNAT